MNKLLRDFVSEDTRIYRFKIGRLVASSLAGFIIGALVASIIWGVAFYLYLLAQQS